MVDTPLPGPTDPQAQPQITESPAGMVDASEHDTTPGNAELVAHWLGEVEAAETHWAPFFKQMRENQEFAAKGADKKWIKDGCYRVPILNRHINTSVAALYARNPKASVKRRQQLMYKLWDGRADTLQAAMQIAETTGDPNAMAILQEIQAVMRQDLMLDRMAKTLEVTWEYYLNEQSANYRQQLKALVRRAKVCGVAYVKLVFQRALEQRPEITAKIEDTTSKIEEAKRLQYEQRQGNIDADSGAYAKLQSLLADLRQQQYVVVREGPVLDFPKSTEVLIDPEVVHLKSLAGASWIAFPYEKTREDIEKTWGVDLGTNFAEYVETEGRRPPVSAKAGGGEGTKRRKVKVYEIWDKESEQKFVICKGYPDFLEAPASPKPQTERFWPLFPLVFNEVEHDELVIPPSDVEQAKDIQNEYNRSREGLRQHRIAARPYYVEAGTLGEADRNKLANHLDHEVITIGAMSPGQDIAKLVQRGPTAPIDPNLYEVEIHFKDILRVVGTQEASLGNVPTKGSATGESIAENSRMTANADSIDDLDEMLSELSRAAGQMMLLELSKQTVMEIAGPGAVWPDMPVSRTEACKMLYMDIEAGSSGRPNQAAELANLERATPFLVQVPGINPAPIARRYGELLELPIEDFIAEGMPSIVAINALLAKQAAAAQAQQTGNPMSAPGAQGPAGGQNGISVAPLNEPGPQPGYPAPAPA